MKQVLKKNKLWLILLLLTLGNQTLNAQTVLISPTGDGGFETGATFAANGWTVVNAASNLWEVGTVATQYAGSRGVYVANPAGTYAYAIGTSRTSHFYKDVLIPASATNITLSFYWKGKGESGFDRTLIYTAPNTVTPVANTPSSSTTTLTGATLIWTQPTFTTTSYGLATITIPDALAGTTVRLIFTWQNDGSLGTTPGTAIDNISMTCVIPAACSGTPTGGTANATITSGCSGYTSSLSVTGSSVNTGLTYQWESSPTGGAPWTPVSGATSAIYSPTITSALYFRRSTTCTASSSTDYSTSILLSIANNDNCINAIPINPDTACSGFSIVNGTIGCATNSGVTAPTGTADDDVWFSFVAEATSVNITIGNTGGSDLVTQFFKGTCGSLVSEGYYDTDPSNTSWQGLTIGTTYYIRVYSWGSTTITGNAAQFTLCVTNIVPPPVQPPCTNLGFESGFTGWYGTEGNSIDGPASALTPTYIPEVYNETTGSNFTLMTAGTDPVAPINTVYSGSTSLRLGTASTSDPYGGASIEQTFLVTASNTDFAYNYAVVLQDGGSDHTDNIQPFFQAQIFDGNGNEVTCGLFQVAAPGTGASFIQIGTTDKWYKPWTTVSVNLTAYIGQNVTIRFIASDCSWGAHYGYAYIDCSCAAYGLISPAIICSGQTATLTAPAGAAAYLWSPGGATTASTTVSPTTTTTYTCSITSQGTNPCSFNLSTTVTVNSASSTSASNDGPICEGSTLNLSCLPAGGTSYAWSGPNSFTSTSQNPTIANATTAASGLYTVTVTFTGGCTGTAQTTATVNSNPTITAGNDSPICEGANLNLTASATGATGYSWSGPNSFTSTAQNPTITGASALAAGIYTVTATFTGGCTSTSQTTVVVNSSVTAGASSNSPICEGSSLNLTSTPNGGTNYNWSGPNSFTSTSQNPTISGATSVASGIYTVTVTLTGGCTGTAQTTVVVNANPTPTIGSNTPICSGSTLNLTSGGGTGYSWSGPNSFANATQNPSIAAATTAASGTYTVTVTGTGGCTATAQTTVVVNGSVTAGASSNSAICEGATLNLTCTPNSGTNYNWSGPNSFSSTTQNPSISGATSAAAGVYTVTVTLTGGCTGTAQTTVTINPLPTPSAGSNTPICAGSTLNLTSGGGTGYSWSGPNTFVNATQNPSITSATVAADGIYTVTVTGTGGCTATAQTTVVVNPLPTPTIGSNTPICEGATLNLTSGGGTGYSWSGPNSFANATQNPSILGATTVASGTYTVTVTGTGSCTSTAQTTVVVNPLPSPTIGSNTPICAGATLNLTSGGGTSYSWSGPNTYANATQNPSITGATVNADGIYIVTVTGTGGCTATAQTTVVVNANPTPTAGNSGPICAGSTLDLTSGGGTSYSWSGPNSFSNATQNPSIASAVVAATGTYTVTVTGTGGCTATAQTTATVNGSVTAIAGSNSAICAGATLNLTASPNGGTNYSWSGPNSFSSSNQNPSISNATIAVAGTYIVTVTLTGGCTGTAQTTVTINALPTPTIGSNTPICAGAALNLTSGGGTGYSWSGPSSFSNATQNPTISSTTTAASGTYTVTVTGTGSCTSTAQTTVVVNANPTITIGSNSPICENTPLNLTSGGGTGYSWSGPNSFSNANQNPSITGATTSAAGTYTVTVTGTGSCTSTAQTSVVVNLKPTIVITPAAVQICNGSDTTLTASGATTYTWTPTSGITPTTGATSTASPTATTTYTAHGTANGCTDSTQVIVTVINIPSILITPTTVAICPGEQTSLTASGGISYTWSPVGIPTPGTDSIITVSPTGTTTYTVTGTASGCSGTATATVTIKPLPQLNYTPQNPAICVNGSLSLSASGADTYQWSPDSTLSANTGATVTASPHASCVYTLSGTLAGCRDSIQVPFTVNPLPTISILATPPSGCQPLHTSFSATSTPSAQTYAWTMGNNVTSILPTPNVVFLDSGLFDVSLTVTDINGCTNSITETDFITVHPKPHVSFTISPEFGYVSKEVIFSSSITAPNSQWSWSFGDGQSSTVQSPITNHYYGTTGEMNVLHTYTNEFGCSDTATQPYTVIIRIVIPNVFTPNNDGANDTFKIEGLDYVEGAVMKIYNRWGRKVYESDNYKNDWTGEDFAEGVYFYVLTLPDYLKSGPFNGTISLLR